ncbi:MAG: 16S rRNA (cytosine(1402)-N(4))-methyltransferase RsmH [Planctomycetes bacterium]|nr:16S rRNA (cytosine(1402)-N(4))-methyltransferase RsmH [Planctomycetota bacterium]
MEEHAVHGAPGGESPRHVSVLAGPVVELLRGLTPGLLSGWIVDATVGLGGHAERVLDALPQARVLGCDRDPRALELARERLARFGPRARLVAARHSELARVVPASIELAPAAFLFDLGVSSMQLDEPERGFSFQADGPLDMRMDPGLDRTAADIVNSWDERDLADLFYFEGGETRSRAAARAIVAARRRAPFLRTGALADCVAAALGGRSSKIHPATLVFQALRRAVNQEGEELASALAAAERLLAPGGRLLVISFHSGEDAVVKRHLAALARTGRFTLLTKSPVEADLAERRANPRARSAKLRAVERAHQPDSGGTRPDLVPDAPLGPEGAP